VPYQVVGPTALPPLPMPFALTLNPHLPAARANLSGWAREVGMFGEGVWTEHNLTAYDFPLCGAGIQPAASAEELDLISEWLTWGTYADDLYPLLFGRTGDLAAAKLQNDRLLELLPLEGEPTVEPASALEHGLAQLWSRTAGPLTGEQRAGFRDAVMSMIDSWMWELANSAQHRIPDPVDYIEMRRRTFGSDLTMGLARIARPGVPERVLRSRPVQAMENAAADYATLLNDLFSYQKEIQFEGELHNILVVVRAFLDTDTEHALAVTADLMASRLREFQHVVATDLPVLFEEYDLDDEVRAALLDHAQNLRNWLAAVQHWHQKTLRYNESELRNHPVGGGAHLPGPTGIGTAAVRVGV
jgi:germacradienol/geosmin synthase